MSRFSHEPISQAEMTEKNLHTPSATAAFVSTDSKGLNNATRFIVILVAAGAALLSFDALSALAEKSGIRPEFSWIWAVVIDGFIMVATFAAFALKDRIGKSKYYAWTTLIIFVIISIAGNGWHAAIANEAYIMPLGIAVIVTAIPPLALFLAIHLLILMVSPTAEQKEEHLRQQKRIERLRSIEEKELEKIEKAALIKEIRESTAAQMVTSNEPSLSPSIKEIPSAPEVKNAPKLIANLQISESGDEIMTEAEVESKLKEAYDNGEPIPTGKTVAIWLGKSERTGQNLVKKFKESLQDN